MKQIIPETAANYDSTRVIERPDGFYWQTKSGNGESGPFPTLLKAIKDMEYRDDSEIEPGETIEEAESELHIADWIDPDTGEPAELGIPRLEEH